MRCGFVGFSSESVVTEADFAFSSEGFPGNNTLGWKVSKFIVKWNILIHNTIQEKILVVGTVALDFLRIQSSLPEFS